MQFWLHTVVNMLKLLFVGANACRPWQHSGNWYSATEQPAWQKSLVVGRPSRKKARHEWCHYVSVKRTGSLPPSGSPRGSGRCILAGPSGKQRSSPENCSYK